MGPDVWDDNCNCRRCDVSCNHCGSTVGYHVSQPCAPCLRGCNNGHFWMFYAPSVRASSRMLNGTYQGSPLAAFLCVLRAANKREKARQCSGAKCRRSGKMA